MFGKGVFFFCAQAFLAHTIFAQCLGNGIGNRGLGLIGNGIGLAGNGIGLAGNGIGLAGNGIGLGCGGAPALGVAALNNAAVSNSGFTVTSSSPIAPSGVSVVSEYVIEGPVNVGGQLPVLGTVALEGNVPTGGAASTTYSCGNGNVGIVSETGSGIGNSIGLGAGIVGTSTLNAGLGAGLGLNRVGGCNGVY